MTQQPLSPAAQAVRQVFDARYELCGPFDDNWQELCLGAALRAAADAVVPSDPCGYDCCITTSERIRADLLAIVAELEGAQATGSTH